MRETCEDRTGDGLAPPRSEDRLLLDEANHRVANEVAMALAALYLARRSKGGQGGQRMLDAAIERLEGFGEVCRSLASAPKGVSNAGSLLEDVCRALLHARSTDGPKRVVLDICEAQVDGDTARRIAMVAHELVTNALKHAFRDRDGELEIRLEQLSDNLVLSVIDDGPGLGRGEASLTGGTRLGGGIVGELVHRCGGSMECETGPDGTVIHVVLPVAARHAGGISADA